jgi:hypothetical protein
LNLASHFNGWERFTTKGRRVATLESHSKMQTGSGVATRREIFGVIFQPLKRLAKFRHR